jgi:diguanylate cyclase (GGDEF)-like protein
MNFGLTMIDIDHFKQLNDTCGHLVGDNILKQVVKIIERNIFSRDVLCRYGGDEFVLLLTRISSGGTLQATEKIRKEIDEHVFDFGADHESQHVTVSIGLVNFDEVHNKEGEAILKLADDRLLRAKRKGKNKIVYDDDG